MRPLLLFLALLAVATDAAGQQPPAPQPYPRGGQPAAEKAPPRAPAQPQAPEQAPAPRTTVPPPTAGSTESPTEATLGLPIYPSAVFITSYDAGRGQRFYLFGTTAPFADAVAYYRSVLKQKGELVFEEPPTHAFDVGRFREESMAFPPGVTIKDYTWGGMPGYANPKPGAEPAQYPTVLQLVPAPTAGAAGARD
jgi:hypothetical protein